jgi:hypothetical protein
MGRSTILWSIWIYRNDVIFNKKNIILLFADYFQGNLLDSFLEHSAKRSAEPLKGVCRTLVTLAIEVFAKHV